MLWLERSAWLFKSGGCFRCEDIFLEKDLTNELFPVPSKTPTMDGYVHLTVVAETILFYNIVLEDGEPEQSELLYVQDSNNYITNSNCE